MSLVEKVELALCVNNAIFKVSKTLKNTLNSKIKIVLVVINYIDPVLK